MALTKPAGTWTYDDLLALPDDGRRYEIIEGELYEMPSPNLWHATTIMNLVLLLGPMTQSLGGRIFTSPMDFFFMEPIPCSRISWPSSRVGTGNFAGAGQMVLRTSPLKSSAHQTGSTTC